MSSPAATQNIRSSQLHSWNKLALLSNPSPSFGSKTAIPLLIGTNDLHTLTNRYCSVRIDRAISTTSVLTYSLIITTRTESTPHKSLSHYLPSLSACQQLSENWFSTRSWAVVRRVLQQLERVGGLWVLR